jgi:NADH-quinone oxidoreductase subunit G
LADICPVGALTAKDFRFQCRVWFLEKTNTVCTLCARGCNTTVSVNPNTRTLYRVEPRRNPEVNKSWICDNGRWAFHYVGNDKRIKVPRKHVDGRWMEQSWHNAFRDLSDDVAEKPEKILVALGTSLTNEEIADLTTSLKAKGVKHFTWVVDEEAVGDRKPYDGILKHRDTTANAMGFETVMKASGISWMKQKEAGELMKKGGIERVLIFGLEGEVMPGLDKLMELVPKQTKVAVHATSESPLFEAVEYVLPNVSSYEKNGTVINAEGRLQKVNAALPWQFTSRDAHAVAFGIDRGGDREMPPAGRAQGYFESTVVEKILLSKNEKWRSFNPFGIPVTENRAHG